MEWYLILVCVGFRESCLPMGPYWFGFYEVGKWNHNLTLQHALTMPNPSFHLWSHSHKTEPTNPNFTIVFAFFSHKMKSRELYIVEMPHKKSSPSNRI